MPEPLSPWICCQLGAREHYAIPRALHQAGQLNHLITDAWVPPQSWLNQVPLRPLKALQERFHPDLTQATIHAFTGDLIQFELSQRLQKTAGWDLIMRRDRWFQQRGLSVLEAITPTFTHQSNQRDRPTLFAYSYAALELFRYAKQQGWRTVLGQIDPGPIEHQLVAAEQARYPTYQSRWQPAPAAYWQQWAEECQLADRILVNSSWSGQALQQVGVPASKIDIVPLAYQPPALATNFQRIYPQQFTPERPLRVLFLGQVILRKGIAALLEAADLLKQQPIEFWVVGNPGITLPPEKPWRNLRWIGSVPRSETATYYRSTDLFLFPTLSDGFGLTQLEAQAWKLPIIASRFCGAVVKDQMNGLLLPEVTADAIATALHFCLAHPEQLAAFAEQSSLVADFSLVQLQHHLLSLPHAAV